MEDLKFLNGPGGASLLKELFEGDNFVVKSRANLAWKDLGKSDSYDFKKVARKLPLKTPAVPTPESTSKSSAPSSRAVRKNQLTALTKAFGFTRKKGKEGFLSTCDRLQRLREKRASSEPIDVDAASDGESVPPLAPGGEGGEEESAPPPPAAASIADALENR